MKAHHKGKRHERDVAQNDAYKGMGDTKHKINQIRGKKSIKV